MTLQQIKYVIYVAKYGSISEAAKKLYMSQPSLSVAIKGVETEFGIKIFKRSGSGVMLTNEGKEFLNDIKHINEYTNVLESKYKGKNQHKMTFSIATMHYDFALDAFLRLMDEVYDEYNFGFLECKTLDVIEYVDNGLADIGIICFSKVNSAVVINELKNRNIIYQRLIERKPCIYIRKGHPLENKKDICWEDLTGYPTLSFFQGIEGSINFSNELIYPINTKKIVYISDRYSLLMMLMNSDAYILGSGLPTSSIYYQLVEERVINTTDTLSIIMILKEKTKLSGICKRYIEVLKDIIDDIVNNRPDD